MLKPSSAPQSLVIKRVVLLFIYLDHFGEINKAQSLLDTIFIKLSGESFVKTHFDILDSVATKVLALDLQDQN